MDYRSIKVKNILSNTPTEVLNKQDGWVKLNENESPYPPSEKVISAIKNADIQSMNLYPDKYCSELRKTIASQNNCKPENIFTGVSSSEILTLVYNVFFADKKNVQMPDVSYYYYPIWATANNVGVNYKPVNPDYTINVNDYKNSNGVLIANPNAPTSLALSPDKIEHIVKNNQNGVVVIDEAYIDFANVKSCADLIHKYKNLLVVRTLSKAQNLAGLRMGYALGDKGIISDLWNHRSAFISYAPNTLSPIVANAALLDTDYSHQTQSKIIQTRDNTAKKLRAIGHEVKPSETNFLFVRTNGDAKEIFEKLKNQKILVRHWEKPRLQDHLRISVGTDEEMEKLVNTL